MQIVLQNVTSPGATGLRALTDLVRQQQAGAFPALIAALARVLVRLADRVEEDEPRDLVAALWWAVVRNNASTLTEIQSAVRTLYRHGWRAKARRVRRELAFAEEEALAGELAPAPDDPEPPLSGYVADGVITEEQQYVLVAHELWGLDYAQIAAELGTTSGAARHLASRAREAIRKAGIK